MQDLSSAANKEHVMNGQKHVERLGKGSINKKCSGTGKTDTT